jgi:hypothetical protein
VRAAAKERHALDPKSQRLPRDAANHPQREQRLSQQRAAQVSGIERLQAPANGRLQQEAIAIVIVDANE